VTGLSIGEVARRSGIPATTLRYYEELGLIEAPSRTSGQRRYGEEILDVLTIVDTAKASGFGLGEIKELLDAIGRGSPGPAWRAIGASKRSQLQAQIRRLRTMVRLLDAVTACECGNLRECADGLRART
jgi:MerR family redox-sensitive transcriptional activator SoxR